MATTTLGDDFPVELARVRELSDAYREIGPAGRFGLMMLTDVIQRAEAAQASGDVVAMLRAYNELKGCE